MRIAVGLAACLLSACAGPDRTTTPGNVTPAMVDIPRAPDQPLYPESHLKGMLALAGGDLDAILERGYLRILVATSRTHFEISQGFQRGRTHDAGAAFQAFLNQRSAPKTTPVVLVPTSEAALIPDLLAGRGDIASNVRLTFARDEQVAFATPMRTGVRELVVTAPNEPPLVSLEDVGGRTIHVREGSDHHASLARLNEQLAKINRLPARIVFAAPIRTDEDLLEMMNMGGDIPATIVDDYVFDAWRATFDRLKTNREVAVSQDGVIAWVTRKESAKLLALVNEFFATHRLTF